MPVEGWTHTAMMVVLPAEGVERHHVRSLREAAEEVLASPEFDEVSMHLVFSTSGSPAPAPSLDALLLEVLAVTEAPMISIVWCGPSEFEDSPLFRDLAALHAVHAESPLVLALGHGSSTEGLAKAVRETALEVLEVADGIEGAPRAIVEAAVTGFSQLGRHVDGFAEPVLEPPARPTYPPVLEANPAHSLPPAHDVPPEINWPNPAPPVQGIAGMTGLGPEMDQDASATGLPNPETGLYDTRLGLSAPEELDPFTLETRTPPDSSGFGPRSGTPRRPADLGGYGVVEADTGAVPRDSSPGRGYEAEGTEVLPEPSAVPISRPDAESPGWIPPVVQNVVGSLSSQIEQWRARRTRVRAEEQIGISALEELPVSPGVDRPLIYFAQAASTDWDKQAVRTRDAALTLLSGALDPGWIAAAFNLSSALTRVAGPDSLRRVAHSWRRIERSNDFDLGDAAAALSVQLERDISSLRLRGHTVEAPHVVVFATEPPYVDSAAHSAYLELLGTVRSVTWLLVGDSDWMEVPPELEKHPSRFLYAGQDGVAILLSEVLGASIA